MPLVRFQVRNEYGLGASELYKTANKDDPKALLDGVSVAGLVGILRQLGDLAEFAAEVFHGVQEQLIATAARSQRMAVRIQHIEAALPPLEKAVLAQTSHIHLAYTSGSEWRANIKTEQNHFIHSDLPRFIMDSYEESRDPPRLYLLDKFDTGGPGACLRRYSDPTFFKKVVASSESVNTEKVQREKKSRKSKKRGSKQRTGEVLNAVQISNSSGRTRFASPNISEQSSASETISTFDKRSKSELVDHCSSFDLRNRSGYIECVFDASSSIRPEEQVDNESSTSRSMMQNSDTISPVRTDEQNGIVDDDLPQVSLHEKNILSTSVTWDEKTEIVKPRQFDRIDDEGEASELLPERCDRSKLEREDSVLGNVDANDILFADENTVESLSGVNRFDELESEPENFMDALNTIESEIDTDSECQTKREVELSLSSFQSKEIEPETGIVHDVSSQTSDSSNAESHTVSYISSNNERSTKYSNLVYSENSAPLQPSQFTGTYSNENVDDLRMHGSESITSDPSSSGSSMPFTQAPSNAQEVSTEISGDSSIKFWTNGGLLGLEPSKPPDFSVSNAITQNSTSGNKDETRDPSCQTVEPKTHVDEFVEEIDISAKKSSREFKDDIKAPYSEATQEKIEMSSISGRLHGNGFQRKASHVHSCSSEPVASVKDDAMKMQEPLSVDQKRRQNVVVHQTSPRPQFEHESLRSSLSSSPPLEHMKISFHPINGFDTSKLKLEFSDGHHLHESISDGMFPSFQLLPEPGIRLQNIDSESDDDTFCRSSLYMSEDLRSHHSESNSEEWESGETPRSKDRESYDALRRVSSVDSIFSSSEIQGIAHGGFEPPDAKTGDPFHSGPSLDLPSFTHMNSLISMEETKNDSDPKNLLDSDSQFSSEPLPPPPPLPPVEWRTTKSHFFVIENGRGTISEAADHPKDLQTTSEQSKPAPPELPHIKEANAYQPKSKETKQDHQKLNGHKESNQATNGNEMDEKEDFLHQIRTKSFSLRRTTPTRPTLIPAPTTNVKVSAILEKANAIRQACVGSDDGGDDENWSDG